MDRRRLLLILAVFVAVIGTALVFLYVKGADKRAKNQYDNVSVLKATGTSPPARRTTPPSPPARCRCRPVPQNAVSANEGYQTTTTALKGTIASVPIFAGQLIIASQFGDGSRSPPTRSLPIPKGMIAISVNLTDPDRVAGNVHDRLRGRHLRHRRAGRPCRPAQADRPPSCTGHPEHPLLLPKVTVLNVGSTAAADHVDHDRRPTAPRPPRQLPRTLLTLAVTQKEAQKVILASKARRPDLRPADRQQPGQAGPGTSTLVASLFK